MVSGYDDRIKWDEKGVSLFLAIPREQATLDRLNRMLRDLSEGAPYHDYPWRDDLGKKQSQRILDGQMSGTTYFWQDPKLYHLVVTDAEAALLKRGGIKPGKVGVVTPQKETNININSYTGKSYWPEHGGWLDHYDVPYFEMPDHVVIGLQAYEEHLPVSDHEKTSFIVDRFRRAVNAVQPTYAWIDYYGKNVFGKNGVDLRKFAWGVTVYGPDYVERIGREKLLKTAAWKVEELPWGGVWVEADKNPFLASTANKKAIVDYLGLDRVFTDAPGLIQYPPRELKK